MHNKQSQAMQNRALQTAASGKQVSKVTEGFKFNPSVTFDDGDFWLT